MLIEMLSERIVGVKRTHPVRIAIDGVDGVGKTMLADELADTLSTHGRPVIRASIDGFHNPRIVRYRLGRNSPEGYFQDSFNYEALTTLLLAPLGPGGTRVYRRAVFNYRTDSEMSTPFETADQNAILLFDGIFLHRTQLLSYWDLSIFLDAPFEVTIPRAAGRDGSLPDVNAPENRRYVEGQQLYLRTCEPKRAATIVINNENLASPEVVTAQSSRTIGQRRIVVVDYDPVWASVFEGLRARAWAVVGDFALAIEHIGSTSVPGLAAKPIIDMSVVVRSTEDVPLGIERLATLGYVHRGNLGVEGREAFQSPAQLPAHHLYLCPAGSLGLINPLALRDYLRAHPEVARAYGNLKKTLALEFPNDMDSYLDGKTDLILGILRQVGFSRDQLDTIERINRKPQSGGTS
jgi:uridine kinase